MKNEAQHAKKVNALIKRIKQAHAAQKLEDPDPVTQLVYAFLEWNASRPMALKAHHKIMQVMVDNNDLRVSHPHEMVQIIGESYPQSVERSIRLHESLQEIFVREHIVSLAVLTGKGKKQCLDYLESLPGIPDYVVRAVMLSLGHGMLPVDDVAVLLLEQEEAIEPDSSSHDVAAYLEKHVEAKDVATVALHLRGWCDESTKLLKSLKKTQVLEAPPPVSFELISSEPPKAAASAPEPAASGGKGEGKKGAKQEKPAAEKPAPGKSAAGKPAAAKPEKKPAGKGAAKEPVKEPVKQAKEKPAAKTGKKAPAAKPAAVAKPAAKPAKPAKSAAKAAPAKKPAAKKPVPKKPGKK